MKVLRGAATSSSLLLLLLLTSSVPAARGRLAVGGGTDSTDGLNDAYATSSAILDDSGQQDAGGNSLISSTNFEPVEEESSSFHTEATYGGQDAFDDADVFDDEDEPDDLLEVAAAEDFFPLLRAPDARSGGGEEEEEKEGRRRLQNCPNWCVNHSKPWSKKCTWTNCGAASCPQQCDPPPDTYFDKFSSGGYGGNYGTEDWTGPWTDDTGVWITDMLGWCKKGYCLRLITDYNSDVRSERGADLSGASSAYVNFDYRTFFSGGGSARVEVSSDGTNYNYLGTISEGEGRSTYDIPSGYLTSDFRLRFRAIGSGWNDVYIDNVSLEFYSNGGGGNPNPPPTTTPAPPTPNPPAQQGNYADDFDNGEGSSSDRHGDDGTLSWTDSWTDEGFLGMFVTDMSWCHSGYCLRLINDRESMVRSDRGANLSGASSAQVTFDYSTTFEGGTAYVEVSSDGANYVTLGTIPNGQGSSSYDVPSGYLTSAFRLRFTVTGSGRNDVYIDNVSVDLDGGGGGGVPGPTPTPASPTPAAPTPSGGQLSSGCGLSAQTGHRYVHIASSNVARKYYISVPSGYNPNVGYPVVFGYHGIHWTGDIMRPYLRLEETSAASQAIFVYPDSLNRYWPEWGNNWYRGWLTGQTTDNEDFIFFDDILDDVADKHCVDMSRVYVTGQSWGGDMATSLPCARGSRIAASVSVASNEVLFFKGYPAYSNKYPEIQAQDCDRPVPMMTMHGIRDTDYEAWEAANWWYDINGCTSPAGGYGDKKDLSTLGTDTYHDGGCAAPNVYYLYTNEFATEHWTDDHNIPQDYEDVTMNFFLQHALP